MNLNRKHLKALRAMVKQTKSLKHQNKPTYFQVTDIEMDVVDKLFAIDLIDMSPVDPSLWRVTSKGHRTHKNVMSLMFDTQPF